MKTQNKQSISNHLSFIYELATAQLPNLRDDQGNKLDTLKASNELYNIRETLLDFVDKHFDNYSTKK